jgi:hypothetical protein
VVQISILPSIDFAQPPAFPKNYQQTQFYGKHERSNCFGQSLILSARHRSALRWLLIISGNVELNPGPITIDFAGLGVGVMKNVLKIVKEQDLFFVMPTTKDEMVNLLEKENPSFVALAIQKTLGIFETAAAQVPPPEKQPQMVKLQTFSTQDTRNWFNLADQLFANSSDEQGKKNSVLRVIPIEIQTESGVDYNASYEAIKQKIIAHCDDSQDQKLRKLLGEQKLGEQKPSTALRKLQALGQGNEKLVRLRFLEIMPKEVRVVLATLKDDPLDKIAEVADMMIEQLPQSSVNAIDTSANNQPNSTSAGAAANSEISELRSEISELAKAVQAITLAQNNQPQQDRPYRGRPRTRYSEPGYYRRNSLSGNFRSRSRSQSPRSMYREGGRYCYYHFEFGNKAFRCKPPCQWKNDGRADQTQTGQPGNE